MDPTIWGPHFWFVLHTIAFNYPKHPTSIQKKIYHRFIHNLYEFLPSSSIAATFTKILEKHPVTPYLDSRSDFIKWMHFMHNLINKRLEKPMISLADHYTNMEEIYHPKPSRLYLHFIFLGIILGILYFISQHMNLVYIGVV